MRLRITFSKTGSLRYIGHLDLQTVWERTLRRAGLPLAYTQGFHPGPKIQIASALPLGFTGRAEIVDVWLSENGATASADVLRPYEDRLQSAAPPGLTILSVEQVDDRGPALQTQVVSAEYAAILLEPMDEAVLMEKVTALLEAASLPRERRGKPYDLRLLVEALEWEPASSSASGMGRLFMRLAAREGATGRPEEVLAVLSVPLESTRIERTRLILKSSIE
jgi:radical SAM-linked protein